MPITPEPLRVCPDPILVPTLNHSFAAPSHWIGAGTFPARLLFATFESSTRRIRLCWEATGAPTWIASRLSGRASEPDPFFFPGTAGGRTKR